MPRNKKDYDIEDAFAAIEDELIDSMIRNMKRHRLEEDAEDKQWEMWQALQLKSLEEYKKKNQKKFTSWFSDINARIDEVLREANKSGYMDQEVEILEAIKKGFKGYKRSSSTMQAEFFKLNERKLEALIKATTDDMKKAETAILRMANDQYRKVIFNAQVYANSGAGTYEKAVDMATKDMLSSGLNCVEYANGARHTLKDYSDMAIRTASKRAYLQGEGEKRQEWGISTVIMNKRGNPCPKCLPFCGKILIDDVWSGGSQEDGPYPLMSKAIAAGLYHPRCKDSHTTYFEGISNPPDDEYTQEEIQQIEEDYREEQRKQYAKRQATKYNRLVSYSLDAENKKMYRNRYETWNQEYERYSVNEDIREHRKDTPQRMVELVEQYTTDNFVVLDDNSHVAYAYDADLDAVVINVNHPLYPHYDYREIMIHEIAHRIDQNEFGSPMHLAFSSAITKAESRILQNENYYRKIFEPKGEMEYNNLVSDIFGCITDNVIVGQSYHDSQYIGIPGYAELEIFANMYAVLYRGDDLTVEFIKRELPEIYQAFLEIME